MALKTPTIILYTITGCSSCAALKKLLTENQLEYREINADAADAYLEMARVSGQREQLGEAYTPVTLIWDDQWHGHCFIGINKTLPKIKKILHIE
ncbi:MAG: glutaredoxin family protein [Candidatus Helarchaeota archaeon]